ncbi:hypothetical protein [Blastococcus sp. PRF04-17]|uniref:hypothetical protein n=1 Tax=Blastococcus sp. PRF04-17 TaxID=2933797 RepID=UPI001FF29A4B|nr:hypothetical protein [Blastococcus sp. PRF04-17]UOY00089.1 hypothetical protein MVA48_13800 [Blastococcus sp. PRF04-17]
MILPGPDLHTLRAWAEVNLALERDVPVDAAHALITDAADAAFGPRLYDRVTEALAAEGRDPEDLSALLDDAVGERVLGRVRARTEDDAEAPDDVFSWSAYAPDDPNGGRETWRRAVLRRRRNARLALVTPRRPAVAGRRRT